MENYYVGLIIISMVILFIIIPSLSIFNCCANCCECCDKKQNYIEIL